MIRGDYIIELSTSLRDNEYEHQRFVIQTPSVTADDGGPRKTVTANSLEYEFASKRLLGYKSTADDDLDVLVPKSLREILTDICQRKMDGTWRVGYIDKDVDEKKRLYDFTEGTVLQFFDELKKSFRCVFRYDTIARTISAYDITIYNTCPVCGESAYLSYFGSTIRCANPNYHDPDTGATGPCPFTKQIYGRDTGLYLTDKNYIKSFEEDIDHSQIVTRLYVYGKDDMGIHDAADNTSGQPYLEDFSFYRNSDYMSARLLAALDRYDETVTNAAVVIPYTPPTTKKYTYSELLTEKADLQSELSTLTKGSAEQKEVLTVLQQLMDDLRGLYSKQLEGITEIDGKPIRDIIAEATEKFETDYAKIDLSYGLDALEEASRIYQKRIDTIIEVNANTPYPDYNPGLALTDYWEKGSKFTFSLPNGDGTSKSYSVTLSSQSSSVTIPSALGYDGSQTLGVTLNGIVQKADYQYAVSSDYQRIVKVGENLLPAKRRVDELIEEKRVLVEAVQGKISAVEQAIVDLNWMIAKENPDNFTSQHIAELNRFIKEDVYRNADIGIPDLTDGYGSPEYYQATSQLYRDGKNAFATLFQPPVSFTTDIINFMGVLSCQDDWDRLSLGDMIHVCHTDAARPDYIVRIIRIEHDGKNQTINLGLTNQDNLQTAECQAP